MSIKKLFYFSSSNGTISSTDSSPNGDALLFVKKKDKLRIQIKVLNLEKCAQVLNIAKEKRLTETKLCLESIIKKLK